MVRETATETAIERWFRANNCTYVKTHGSSLRSGEPDYFASLPPHGTMLAIEVKRPGGGEVSVQQRVRLAQWRRSGAITASVRSVEELDGAVRKELHRRAVSGGRYI